jgi:hypothetical protein
LPADFETFGQAVATSMADLLGGTTGQVLSKASNTDMDFTWVAQDDSNAIQNAIVDAKGDLIAASAADTPARLAVGTNNFVLTAASGEPTGLKWALPDSNAAWTFFTPTVTSGSGSMTTVTAGGLYLLTGKTVNFTMDITITNAGTGAGLLRATLPNTPNSSFEGTSHEINSTGFLGCCQIPSGDGGVYLLKYDNTTFIASGRRIIASGTYTVA